MSKQKHEYSRYYRSKHFSSLCLSVVLDVLEKLGTTRSLSIAIAIRYGQDPGDLLTTDPLQYFDAYSYHLDAQAVALVKKSCFLDLDIDSEAVEQETLRKWLTIEEELYKKNEEIRLRKNFELNSVLENARKILANLLPPVSSITARSNPIPKGATALLKGLDVNIANKLEVLDITSSAFRHFKNYYGVSALARAIKSLSTSLGSTFDVALKDLFKRRVFCKEPMGNMILQLDAARPLRRALGRIDINLENQQEFHGFLVRNFFEEFATIDLSDASDRICVQLVKAVLPTEWFDYLNDIRSKWTFLPDGRRVYLEKFSPQGNGFTFELETLIFYAICRSIVPSKELVSVYGDDMIVPVSYAEDIQKALELCGLVVNRKKSYHYGPFRESCGVDTFDGTDVRPVYLKEFSRGLFGYYELYNRIHEICLSTGVSLERAKKRILSCIEIQHQFFGPEHFGDSVLKTDVHDSRVKRITQRYVTYYYVLQRRYHRIQSGFYDSNGKWRKSARKHLYVITCDDLQTPELQLSYALLGFPSEGVTQRNTPHSEVIKKCAFS